MKTQYYTASTLDGFMADAGHTLDWLMQFGDAEGSSYAEFIAGVGAAVMGSTTYEWVLRHLESDGGQPAAWPYEIPVWVLTSRPLAAPAGADVRFARGDVRLVHRAMAEAAGGKNVWVAGGGEVAGQFLDHGLLDEVIVQVAPVTLGRGVPLLPRSVATPPLRLLSAAPFGAGFVELRYEVPKGRPGGGSG